MRRFVVIRSARNAAIVVAFTLLLCTCDRSSSPEGRMQMKLEMLEKGLVDSLKKQNAAILDSLGKIREEIRALQIQKEKN